MNLEGMLQQVSKVKLRGGVVGKVSLTLIAISFSIAAIAWSANNVWLSAASLAAIFCLAFPMLWRLISFADKNPQAALLEGAEFLAHEQLRLGTKSEPYITVVQADKTQPAPISGPSADPALAAKPDAEEPPASLSGGSL